MASLRAEKNGGSSKSGEVRGNVAARFKAARQNEQPDWGRIPAELVWMVVQRLTLDDGAVMFGYSRDGGAYSVKIYAGGEPEKFYAHTDDELIEFLNYALGG